MSLWLTDSLLHKASVCFNTVRPASGSPVHTSELPATGLPRNAVGTASIFGAGRESIFHFKSCEASGINSRQNSSSLRISFCSHSPSANKTYLSGCSLTSNSVTKPKFPRGNFGLVTEFEVRLHPLKYVLLAEGLCEQKDIRRLLEFWREFMPDASHDLKWNIDSRPAPNIDAVPTALRGKPVAGNSLVWTGDPDAGRTVLKQTLALCSKESVSHKLMPFLDLQTMADAAFPHGRRYYTKSGYFTEL